MSNPLFKKNVPGLKNTIRKWINAETILIYIKLFMPSNYCQHPLAMPDKHFCGLQCASFMPQDIDGLMQKRRNSIANALELCLFCIKPSIYLWRIQVMVQQNEACTKVFSVYWRLYQLRFPECLYSIKNHLHLILMVKWTSTLRLVLAWCRAGDKPFSE